MYVQDEVRVFKSSGWKIRNAQVTDIIVQLVFWPAVIHLPFQAPPVPPADASVALFPPQGVLGHSAALTIAVHPLCRAGFSACPGGNRSSDERPL